MLRKSWYCPSRLNAQDEKSTRGWTVIEFKLPELGENIEQGDLVRLMISPGTAVSAGQAVMELETDKAVVEVPSSVNGTSPGNPRQGRRQDQSRTGCFHRRKQRRRHLRRNPEHGQFHHPRLQFVHALHSLRLPSRSAAAPPAPTSKASPTPRGTRPPLSGAGEFRSARTRREHLARRPGKTHDRARN